MLFYLSKSMVEPTIEENLESGKEVLSSVRFTLTGYSPFRLKEGSLIDVLNPFRVDIYRPVPGPGLQEFFMMELSNLVARENFIPVLESFVQSSCPNSEFF
jgi:hypothetical protein